jgi:hypothetical protein
MAIRTDTHEIRALYPAPRALNDWDRQVYPDCLEPATTFSSHGVNVRPLSGDTFRLYVTNHGTREFVEVIDVKASARHVTASWRGCVVALPGMWPNSVVPLNKGGLALAGRGVATWRPGRGWRRVEGLKSGSGNGVEVSRDGQWLFVASYYEHSVFRIPLDGGKPQAVIDGGMLPDNRRWGEDGELYVVGHLDADQDRHWQCVQERTPTCDTGFVISRIDAQNLTAREIYRSDGIQGKFGAGTTALQIGRQIWVGSFIANRVYILHIEGEVLE